MPTNRRFPLYEDLVVTSDDAVIPRIDWGQLNFAEYMRERHAFPDDCPYTIRKGDTVQDRFLGVYRVDRAMANYIFATEISPSMDRDSRSRMMDRRDEQGGRNFKVIGHEWPGDRSPLKAIESINKVNHMRQETKEQFYSLFQIGVEVEGEYVLDADGIEIKSDGYFDSDEGSLKTDGSLNGSGEGECLELVTPVIDTKSGEEKFLSAMKKISSKRVDYTAFAYPNDSAGTHIHLDFGPSADEELKKLGWDESFKKQFFLYLFDSVEFERFFFAEYFRAFKLRKFWKRLQNRYCRTFIQPYNDTSLNADTSLSDIEQNKAGRDRYRWINYECLSSGKGIEFRIFPYVQTVEGLSEVIEFTQATVLRYWKKKATKKNLKNIKRYFDGDFDFSVSTLSKYDRIIWDTFRVGSRYKTKASFDLIEFLAYLDKRGAEKPAPVGSEGSSGIYEF